jgi:hypothetical protein
LGLHGGKYQFSDAGTNYAGQEFAETGYSSGNYEQEGDLENDPLPNWALKLNQIPTKDCAQLQVAYSGTLVDFQNDERSWERYYAVIVGQERRDSPYIVEPLVGMLAPRGGSTDHSDVGRVVVKTTGQPLEGMWWLVVGTEAKTWLYQLS